LNRRNWAHSTSIVIIDRLIALV